MHKKSYILLFCNPACLLIWRAGKKEAKKFWGGIFASAYGICDGFDFGAQMSLLKQAKPHGGKLYFKSINFL